MGEPVYGTPQDGAPARHGERSHPGESAATGEAALRAQAIRRLRIKRAFLVHLMVYLLINLLLVGIWLTVALATKVWFFWPSFPMLGWGVGVALHAWGVFGPRYLREDRIQREMNRLAQG